MLVSITFIELKTPFHFFSLSYNAMKIVKQLQQVETKCIARENTGFWTKHYTMTLWNSKEEMEKFMRSGAHLKAMKLTNKLAKKISFFNYQDSVLPDWPTAKELIHSKGRSLHGN
jgi:hypothetical protein